MKSSKRKAKSNQVEQHELVQVDAFMIPAPFADMYRVLREAVAEEWIEILQQHFPKVLRVSDHPEEGEAVVAYDDWSVEQVRLYLNPINVSEAQKARDKHQHDKFVESFIFKKG